MNTLNLNPARHRATVSAGVALAVIYVIAYGVVKVLAKQTWDVTSLVVPGVALFGIGLLADRKSWTAPGKIILPIMVAVAVVAGVLVGIFVHKMQARDKDVNGATQTVRVLLASQVRETQAERWLISATRKRPPRRTWRAFSRSASGPSVN